MSKQNSNSKSNSSSSAQISKQSTNANPDMVANTSAVSNKGKGYSNERNKRNSKSTRSQKNRSKKPTSENSVKVKQVGFNDIAWYARNPELLRSAASFPFSTIVGTSLPWASQAQYLPGVMSIGWSPAFGGGTDPVALNQAKDSLYSFLVHANSRNYSYDASDLMVLILAGAQVFSALAHVIRAYGVIKSYREQNLFMPDTLIKAMGFIPSDFRANLSSMWFDINDYINRSSQIWIPNTLPLISRWFWMNSNVYTDADNVRGQLYVFVPVTFFKYNFAQTNEGGGLDMVTVLDTDGTDIVFNPWKHQYTWAQWKEAIDSMFTALIEDEDRGIIYGDILNAYGAERIYSMTPIPADFIISPVFNLEVLTQIENLTTCAYSGSTQTPEESTNVKNSIVITGLAQDADKAKLEPVYIENTSDQLAHGIPNQIVLNFHQDTQPTPEQIMIATRLTAAGARVDRARTRGGYTGDVQAGLKPAWVPAACGSEFITAVRVFGVHSTGSTSGDAASRILQLSQQSQGVPTINSSDERYLMPFDWHPFQYGISSQQTTTPTSEVLGKVWDAMGEFDNYTVVDWSQIDRLHSTALFSLYGVPQM